MENEGELEKERSGAEESKLPLAAGSDGGRARLGGDVQ